MAMKVLPHLPCWTEVNDPKTGCWEFVSVQIQHRPTWDKVRFAVANYFLKERHPALISARVYGKTHDSAKVTVVVCSADISKQKYCKLQALCTPFALLPIIESVRPTVEPPAPPAIFPRYKKILTHATPLGVKGVDSIGGFGGYLKVNDEIFGTTCSHCVVPGTKFIKYRETRIRLQRKSNRLRREITIHFSLNSMTKRKGFESPSVIDVLLHKKATNSRTFDPKLPSYDKLMRIHVASGKLELLRARSIMQTSNHSPMIGQYLIFHPFAEVRTNFLHVIFIPWCLRTRCLWDV